MDQSSLIIGFSCLAIAILPFVFINRKAKKLEKTRKNEFLIFVKQHQGNILVQESWNNRIIGLDRYSKRLFYYYSENEIMQKEIIDLAKINSCSVEKSVRKIVHEQVENQIVEKIELVFNASIHHIKQPSIVFYSIQIDALGLNGEIQLANKWSELINKDVKTFS